MEKFYSKKEFEAAKNIKKVIRESSCVVLKNVADEEDCINRKLTDDIIAFAKFFVEEGDDALTANIPSSLAAEVGMTEKQVFKSALESAQKKLPLILSEKDDGFYIMHTNHVFGAATFLYDGALSYVANELGGDYYILPSDEDFLTVIKKSDIKLPDVKYYLAAAKNKLSDDLFVYYKDHNLLRVIGKNDKNVIYLRKGVMRL